LVGGGDNPTGVFAMDFFQPPYQWETSAFQANIDFAFKKSVFFARGSLQISLSPASAVEFLQPTALLILLRYIVVYFFSAQKKVRPWICNMFSLILYLVKCKINSTTEGHF